MVEQITLSGMGGQGVISLGNIIGYSGMLENKYVSVVPSYGAEMRGGISNCFVVLSNKEIGSPVVSNPDVGILFYQPAINKYLHSIKKDGMLIYNENMVFDKIERNDIRTIGVPANYTAEEIGNIKTANVILAGVWCKIKKIVQYDNGIKAIEEMFKTKGPKLIDLNKKAFDFGYNFVE